MIAGILVISLVWVLIVLISYVLFENKKILSYILEITHYLYLTLATIVISTSLINENNPPLLLGCYILFISVLSKIFIEIKKK